MFNKKKKYPHHYEEPAAVYAGPPLDVYAGPPLEEEPIEPEVPAEPPRDREFAPPEGVYAAPPLLTYAGPPFDPSRGMIGAAPQPQAAQPPAAFESGAGFCPSCGAALPEGARFCAECGAPVVRGDAPDA